MKSFYLFQLLSTYSNSLRFLTLESILIQKDIFWAELKMLVSESVDFFVSRTNPSVFLSFFHRYELLFGFKE